MTAAVLKVNSDAIPAELKEVPQWVLWKAERRDDFDIEDIDAVKVALTAEQIEEFNLPPKMKAKRTSTNYKRFAKAHGDNVFELEALAPQDLQKVLRNVIDTILDTEALNHEIQAEERDATKLHAVRMVVHDALRDLNLGNFGEVD